MIHGAIDYAGMNGRSVTLSGWARHVGSEGARPVDKFTLAGRDDIAINTTDRDINGTPGCGFRLVLPSVEDLAALWWGGLSLNAEAAGEVLTLRFWDRREETVLEIITLHLVGRLKGKVDLATLQDAQNAKRAREAIRSFLDTTSTTQAQESIIVQRGATSHDSEVTIGRDGFLFLVGGSNNVLSQYTNSEDSPTTKRWLTTIRARQDYCATRGIQFFQMIIPEKQSIMPEFFPTRLETPTKLLTAITHDLKSEPFFIDCWSILRDLIIKRGIHPFRKVDSHLSYFGAEEIIRKFCEKIGLQKDIFCKNFFEQSRSGDLGKKFFQGDMLEHQLAPAEDWEFALDTPELTYIDTPKQGHGDTVMEWRARCPLSPQTLLIFGNSMFERGGAPEGLSWWMSRIFARTRFVWSGNMQEKHIEEFSPGMIICQTVERFCLSVPQK
ncbi:conserved protein of unknown function [Rhodovastum atsumiense]|uniref:AlgX/AlgJ SGNH hydrolase-like domain-containing protein n=1 Tax=Rhodovastum atsumiense TaxID=504468 RepID=A0A5M6IZI7_9PROT|nr:hypothetical protein [Rhodovastum atsumiense]KAA5613379.1 hypothetical protein F1189_04775 [Rhodovastum atsumiense]CAH2603059.1 conserved protein of unknown function [Rhodovastum atsumiense]